MDGEDDGGESDEGVMKIRRKFPRKRKRGNHPGTGTGRAADERAHRKKLAARASRWFARHLMSRGEQLNRILFVWGRHFPPGATGCVEAFATLLSSLLDSEISLKVTTCYLEIFKDRPCLRIPHGNLDRASLRFLDFVHKVPHNFFAKLVSASFDSPSGLSYSLMTNFLFDEEIEEEVDRLSLAWDAIHRLLSLGTEAREGAHASEIFEVCSLAIKDVLVDVVDAFPEGERKRETSAFLYNVLDALKKPEWLLEKLAKERRPRAFSIERLSGR